jgi:plasmid stabilization system protein ParE
MIRYTERAQTQIAELLEYGCANFGERAAVQIYRRLIGHIEQVLAAYPRTGRWRDDISAYHAWVPRTPFVVFYRSDAPNDIVVIAVFHAARDLGSLTSADLDD